MNFPPFTMSICNIYEQQTIYIRYMYHSLNTWCILFASFWSPLNSIRCLWKRREGGKIRYMERLYIVSSTDIERCKRMHFVIIECIPWVMLSVHNTFASSVKHPVSLQCVCFEIVPDKPFGRKSLLSCKIYASCQQ